MDDAISRQAVLKLLSTMPPEEAMTKALLIQGVKQMDAAQPEIIRCRDCKHFEYNHIENVNGIPLIVAHEICMRWCEGAKTSENGYCFLAERREESE